MTEKRLLREIRASILELSSFYFNSGEKLAFLRDCIAFFYPRGNSPSGSRVRR
ncbi:unknown protein [Microcystis aeruginosa NIES-843]|uniref:Uncharacterized protein n=1 Tax=Microcystis aeruginosa (strain NIES-843 / IAM M-2473) TaxID=449447 RepID=B0JH36_MICAN|nr:unknown protein [Microcystis aeruginosa NIES-843]